MSARGHDRQAPSALASPPDAGRGAVGEPAADGDLLPRHASLLGASGLAPSSVGVELTESAFVATVDDFGTGSLDRAGRAAARQAHRTEEHAGACRWATCVKQTRHENRENPAADGRPDSLSSKVGLLASAGARATGQSDEDWNAGTTAGPAVLASSRQAPVPASTNTATAAWARAFISQPNRVAAALEAGGAIAMASVIPLRHWPPLTLAVLAAAAGITLACAAIRITIGSRLPRWSLHVDVALGNLLVSVVVAAGASEHIGLANLYLLVALFAVLYLPLRSALAQSAAAGTAYALVLALGPAPAGPAVVAWLAVFATAAALAAVVAGLVSVLRVAAREDPLTGLANRRGWDERLGEEIERSRRAGVALSVAIIDLDGFKAVNDAGGHDAGDQLLRELARAWLAAMRGGGDFLARVGGDEFALLAPGSDETGIRRLARRIADAVPGDISASIGVATWDRTEGGSGLVRRADRSMYQAKRRRRHRKEPAPPA